MYLFIGISSIFMLVKIYNYVSALIKNMDDNLNHYFKLKEYFEYGDYRLNDIIDYETVALQSIILYNKGYTIIKDYVTYIYMNNETINSNADYLYNSYLYIYGELNNIKIEYSGSNWLYTGIMYPIEYDTNYKLVEKYQYIHYNKNQEMSNMIIHNILKPYSCENAENISNLKIKNLYLLKYNNNYLCSHNMHRLFNIWNGDVTNASNPFFEIEYKDEIHSIMIDIPKSYFVVGNELLSSIFLKRWFEYTILPEDFIYTNNYTVHITDDDFNDIELKNNQYIIIENNGYRIEKIK